jgi:hypothetical protein
MTSAGDGTAKQPQPQEPQLSLLRFCGSYFPNKINALKEAQKRNLTRRRRKSAVTEFINKINILGEAQKRNFSLPNGKVPPAEAGEAPIPGTVWWDDG